MLRIWTNICLIQFEYEFNAFKYVKMYLIHIEYKLNIFIMYYTIPYYTLNVQAHHKI